MTNSLIVQLSGELHVLCQKAAAYDEMRDMLEEIWRRKADKIGMATSEKICSLLNRTPSSLKPVPDDVLKDWDDR